MPDVLLRRILSRGDLPGSDGGIYNPGALLTDELVAEKSARAEELRRNPRLLARVKAEAAAKMAKIPPRAKGVVGVTTLKAS